MSIRSNRSGELPTSRRSNRPGPPDPGLDPRTATFTLVVVEGPDAGASFVVDGSSPSRVLVGQSPLCDLELKDAEVSRRHLSIRATPSSLEVRDLESTNGTTVNGVTIKEAILYGGETLRLGGTVLSLTRGEPEFFAALTRASSFGRLIGESRAMRKLYPVLERLAQESDAPILIEGEAGTGKELCAEELHARSKRNERPFLTLETATLDAADIDTRLFGEDALVQQAQGGTLVIDDAAELPMEVQAKLAKLPRDGSAPRLIFTTTRDLDRAVTDGTFREDLLSQLASSNVELPPLRERDVDVKLLATTFWKELAGPHAAELPGDFLPRFEHYPWPGNVRELRSALEARLRLGELSVWKSEQAVRTEGDFIGAVVSQALSFTHAKQIIIGEFERRYVDELVVRHGGSIQRAAAASGLAQRYFQLIRARHKK